MKKKILLVTAFIFGIILSIGCSQMMNTPTKQVEEFLNKYQTMDDKVMKQLDKVIDSAGTMTKEQKEKYRELMKNQYKNLTYKIKDDTEDGDEATVEVEIEVYDYITAIKNSESYLLAHKEEFLTEEKEVDDKKFMDYKLKEMDNIKDKKKYTLHFVLEKKDKDWKLEDITDIDRQKLHGLYD